MKNEYHAGVIRQKEPYMSSMQGTVRTYVTHQQSVILSLLLLNTKQANIWDEVAGKPQVLQRLADENKKVWKRIFRWVQLDRLNWKENDESWWTSKSILRAKHTRILRHNVGSTFENYSGLKHCKFTQQRSGQLHLEFNITLKNSQVSFLNKKVPKAAANFKKV